MKKLKIFFLSLILILSFSTGVKAEFFTDVIVTSANGIWTDSRAYATLNAAITAVGANQRTVTIVNQQVVTSLTVPANVTLRFERDGSIANSGQLTINTLNIIADNHQLFTGAGDIDFAQGTIVKSSWFAGIYEALTLTADDTITMLITKQETLHISAALGNNVTLKWDSQLMLGTAAGITMSNIGQIDAGNYQILSGAGNFRFRDGTNLNLSWFAHLRSAITHINTNNVTLTIHGTNTVDYTDTVPPNINLDFRSYQGILSISAGINLTIPNAGQIDAKNLYGCIDQTIFIGLGTVSYAGPFCADSAAADQGATTNTRSIKSLLNDIGTAKSATIRLTHSSGGNSTTYTVMTPIAWASYPLVKLDVEPGAIIAGTITGLPRAEPEWFATNTVPGTTDMTSAIAAASAAVAGNGGIVQMDNIYGVSTAIAMKSNVTYRGIGTLKVISATAFSIFDDGEADLENITFDGLTFDGSLNYSAAMIAGTVYPTGLAVYNNAIVVSRGTGSGTQVKNFTVKNCTFNYISGNGILLYAVNMQDIWILNNNFSYGYYLGKGIATSKPGSDDAQRSKRVTVSGNHLDHGGPTVFYDPSYVYYISSFDSIQLNMSEDSTVSANTVNYAASIGIRIEDSSRVAVVGNTVSESGANGIEVYKGCEYITVVGNTVRNWGRSPWASSMRSYGGKYYIARETPNLTLATLPTDPSTSHWFQEWPYDTSNINLASVLAYDDSDYDLLPFRGNTAFSCVGNCDNSTFVGNIAVGKGDGTYASDYGFSIVHCINSPSNFHADATVIGNSFTGANIADIYRPNYWDPINARGALTAPPKIYNNDYSTSYAGIPTATYTSDFSAGVDSWNAGNATVAGNVDSIGGLDDWLRITSNGSAGTHFAYSGTALVIGKRYRLQATYNIPAGQSNIDGLKFTITGIAVTGLTNQTVTGAVTTFCADFTATGVQLRLNATDGGNVSFTDAGGDDVLYVRGITVSELGTNVDLYNYPVAANNAAAAAAGVPIGGLYRTNTDPAVIHVRTM